MGYIAAEMKMTIRRSALILVTGALMPLAYAPFGLFFVAILGPALLMLAWLRDSPGQAFFHGYLFGLGMFGTGVYWLHISINLFGGVTLLGSVLVTALLVAFLALYPALVGYCGRRWFAAVDAAFLLLAVPALWVLAEWARSWLLTGFPWLNLGYSQIDAMLSWAAPVFGVYGVSWLTVFVASVLAALYRYKRRYAGGLLAGLALLILSSLSLGTVQWTQANRDDIRVALVQGAVPQELKWRPEMRGESLQLYLDLSADHWDRDILIWPETAIPAFSENVPALMRELRGRVRAHGTVFLSGIPSKGEAGEYFNSIMLLSNDGETRYHKRHLVPFGEYLPLKPLLGPVLDFLQIPMSDFSAGRREMPLLESGELSLGLSICYEDTFGEEITDALPAAKLLVNVSNDAWFGDSLAPHQHLQMARMRALESGRYLLRATNNGISAIIDEQGQVRDRLPQFDAATLTGQVSLFEGATPYARWGNYPVVLAAGLVLALLVLNRKKTSPASAVVP